MKERKAEYKPLSFSTTMRNPERIVSFLSCILPFEGKILDNDIIHEVAVNLIQNKLYYTQQYEMKVSEYKKIYQNEEAEFSREQVEDIIKNSPQQHKEAGFDAGWPSRFDTWYKISMEFGFIYYAMNEPIQISTTGHMLIDAYRETPVNNEKIKDVFLNALMKYQTNNPFRKTENKNNPLILLLQVIELLKNDSDENGAGIYRNELPLIICWPDNNAKNIYNMIKEIRKKYKFKYGEEIIYEICLKLLNADSSKKNRFKMKQITGEAVDEFIRKMRITGIISLRGQGRFLDFNTFEKERIAYILTNYSNYKSNFVSKHEYFIYMGNIDTKILSIKQSGTTEEVEDIKIRTLNSWATENSSEMIINELLSLYKNSETKNNLLKVLDRPTRLEFLTSIALVQHFDNLSVHPNYHVDDEGLPTFTAAGGLADIECFDEDCNSLVEVTLMCSKNQAICEIPAITRHLQEKIETSPEKINFSIFIAPSIHKDTEYMVGYSKHQYGIDIKAINIPNFVEQISSKNKIIEMLDL